MPLPGTTGKVEVKDSARPSDVWMTPLAVMVIAAVLAITHPAAAVLAAGIGLTIFYATLLLKNWTRRRRAGGVGQ